MFALLLCSQALFLVAFHGKSILDGCIRQPKIDAGRTDPRDNE